MGVPVQELIHKYEVGAGNRILKLILGFITLIALAVLYDYYSYRNLSTAEGMDAAQLARNISDGKGFSTSYIRPFSIFLLKKHALDQQPLAGSSLATNSPFELPTSGPWRLPEPHPDISNAPLYPTLLAGLLKIMPFEYPNLLTAKSFSTYLPDLWIVGFNQLLLIIAACLVFRLGRRLFDDSVAWVACAAFVGAEVYWRFSLSGTSTLLVTVLFLALTEALTRLDQLARDKDNPPSSIKLLFLGITVGLLLGLGALTRYSFAFLAIPVVLWLAFLPNPRSIVVLLCAVAAFVVVLGPWVYRNYDLTGTPFGTAGYAALQNTTQFPEDQLERSLQPSFRLLNTSDYWDKFWPNARAMLQNDIPKLGGSWFSALFLVGLLVFFRNPTLSRVRVFLILAIGTFFLVQALARTSPSADSPEISSDNLLVITAPVAFIFGAGLLFTLLQSAMPALRAFILGAVVLIACLPLFLSFLAPHEMPVFPPWVQDKAAQVKPDALVMTDNPAAMAWYGHRQSLPLTLKHRAGEQEKTREDFYAFHETIKPISALYLTSKSLKNIAVADIAQWLQDEDVPDRDWSRFMTLAETIAKRAKDAGNQEDIDRLQALLILAQKHWIRGSDNSWASFLLGIYINREVPTGFPLRRAPLGLGPEIFLTDSERKPEKAIQSSE